MSQIPVGTLCIVVDNVLPPIHPYDRSLHIGSYVTVTEPCTVRDTGDNCIAWCYVVECHRHDEWLCAPQELHPLYPPATTITASTPQELEVTS